jgi:Icc-related predicted phosphoesterase
MKFLCVSDQIDPIVYSKSIHERFGDVDVVLAAGDLPMEYVEFLVSSLNVPVLFVFGNHNLSELGYYDRAYRTDVENSAESCFSTSYTKSHGALYSGFRMQRIKINDNDRPLLVAGASGSLRYNNGRCQYTERGMRRKLLALLPSLLYNKIRYGRYLDIFLTHAPAHQLGDREDRCHTGFKCFRWFMEKFNPAYLVHGHIHLYDLQAKRVSTYKNTTIINAYSYHVFEMEHTGEKEAQNV